ncbi:MAG: GNAT family N-acetyltransferase, partial [Azospirillaceae bacterium]
MQGANDNLRPIRRLTEADIPAALALSCEAHWNQVADDWRLFLELGQPIGLETAEGRLVASAASLPHGPRLAWISMVLVTDDWRRRGLATRLMTRAIETVEASGRVPGLDATPAGREVYRPLGFEELFPLTRWRGTVTRFDAPDRAGVRPLADTDM